jgi:signal transduction histidine kinase
MIRCAVRSIIGYSGVVAAYRGPMFRRLTVNQLVTDIAIAAICVLLRSSIGGYESSVTVLVVLGMATALALRRVSPALALIVAWVVVTGQMLSAESPDTFNLAILAVLYATGRYGNGWVKWFGLASAVFGAFIAVAYVLVLPFSSDVNYALDTLMLFFGNLQAIVPSLVVALVAALAVLGFSWTAGLLVKTRAAARENRRAQLAAEQVVVVEQERNRIARDMHDVVAHSLAVVIAQADGARYSRATDPEAVDDALTTISSTAREALGDVRLLLGQLRHSQDAGPQPALADLGRLVEQLRSSGLLIVLHEHGDPLSLPSGQQLAVYRIVQEALTNALRHGDIGREVVVDLDWSMDAAAVTITNAVASPSREPRHGHGLAGMRERALLVGGTFSAGLDGSRFVVRARIPMLVTA